MATFRTVSNTINVNAQHIVDKIHQGRQGREEVVRNLLSNEKLVNSIYKYVLTNSGNPQDGKSILNYALVQFLKTVSHNKDIVFNSSIENYITGTARHLWLHELKKRKLKEKEIPEAFDMVDTDITIDLQIMQTERRQQLEVILGNLGRNCRDVLMYWSMDYSMKEIAALMNYSSDIVARKKKFNCLKELKAIVAGNPSILKALRI